MGRLSHIKFFCLSYCFIHGTMSLKLSKGNGTSGDTFGPHSDCKDVKDKSECLTHHAYYIWIPMMMVIQATISYLPHYLWYYWEGETFTLLSWHTHVTWQVGEWGSCWRISKRRSFTTIRRRGPAGCRRQTWTTPSARQVRWSCSQSEVKSIVVREQADWPAG